MVYVNVIRGVPMIVLAFFVDIGVPYGLNNFFHANYYSGRDDAIIYVTGNEDRILVTSIFDNLGKGASGAAIQCMNIHLGLPEEKGLCL